MNKRDLFDKMTFLPWEGPYYAQGFKGKKIMIVGESYYKSNEDNWTDNPDNYPFASSSAVQKYIFGWNQETFSRITNIILGKTKGNKTTIEERASLWNNVVYYNFIQSGFRDKVNDNSTIPNDWIITGKKILIDALSIYKPDLTILFSKQIWKHYGEFNGVSYAAAYKEDKLKHSTIAIFDLCDNEGYPRRIVGIFHPSRLNSEENWNEINQYLSNL